MHTIAIECSDNAYNHILYFLQNLPKTEALILDDWSNEPNKAIDRPYPQSIIASSVNEVRERIKQAELSESVNESDYKNEMDLFFKNELALK